MKIKKILMTFTLILAILSINFASNFSFAADTSDLTIDSEAAILMDSATGSIIYEKNADKKMYPASTTKILTAILAIENCDLNEKTTASYNAVMSIPSGYSNAAIQIGEELTIEQLLQLLLVHSANEAGNILAEHIGGTIESFASMMNTKAEELGCTGTHFTNPSGVHSTEHYTTARDMAIIAKYCMKNSTFRNLVSQSSCTVAATNKYEERTFTTTNDLLIVNKNNRADNYYYQYAIGIKTGYTAQAKNCLVAASNKDNFELISVVLGAGQTSRGLSARYVDTKKLFEFSYDNYTIEKIANSNDIVSSVEISNATKDTKNLDLLIQDSITALIDKSSNDKDKKPEITLNENLQAPIAQNSVVGTIKYEIDGIEYTSNLLASHSVEKSNFWIIILRIVLIIIVLLILFKLLSSDRKRKSLKKNSKKGKNKKSNSYYFYK